MKNESPYHGDAAKRDSQDYRRFIAGDRTLYSQVFWENGPRLAQEEPASSECESPQTISVSTQN